MTASAAGNAIISVQSQSHSKAHLPSKPTNAVTAFQQSLSQYLQNTTSGAGGGTGANPSQSLGSDLMSSLLQMQG